MILFSRHEIARVTRAVDDGVKGKRERERKRERQELFDEKKGS